MNHHGRLYLTDNHICFSSNILGVKTKFVSYISLILYKFRN
ncbi:MAG: GRAM domain-containing protein [bacterium]